MFHNVYSSYNVYDKNELNHLPFKLIGIQEVNQYLNFKHYNTMKSIIERTEEIMAERKKQKYSLMFKLAYQTLGLLITFIIGITVGAIYSDNIFDGIQNGVFSDNIEAKTVDIKTNVDYTKVDYTNVDYTKVDYKSIIHFGNKRPTPRENKVVIKGNIGLFYNVVGELITFKIPSWVNGKSGIVSYDGLGIYNIPIGNWIVKVNKYGVVWKAEYI